MEISGKGKEMETRKKTNYSIIVVLSTLILFLSAVGVSCGAKKPSPKPSDEPKSKQMTKKKTDQFLQRIEKKDPPYLVRVRNNIQSLSEKPIRTYLLIVCVLVIGYAPHIVGMVYAMYFHFKFGVPGR